jgi:hypothetical protein
MMLTRSDILQPTSEARQYAVRQLAKRAGVTKSDLKKWRIVCSSGQTAVFPLSGSEKCVRFPASVAASLEEERSGFATARFGWMRSPSSELAESIPDFIVPFLSSSLQASRPLFYFSDPNTVECACDLLSSLLFTLSRFEEMLPTARDEYGRFPATASIAFQKGFLRRPIVDEYGLAFEQALSALLPGWQPAPRVPRLKLTHDVDTVGMPFYWRSSLEHVTKRYRPAAALRDTAALMSPIEPTFLHTVRQIALLSIERGLDSAIYWKASPNPTSPRDSGYDPRDHKVRNVIAWLTERGIEQGFHPGYSTFGNLQRLQNELAILRQALSDWPMGGRQHFLRWTPETWEHWERCGLAYDSTVGYADEAGFRAGTCYPYYPWLLKENRPARVLEIPLIIMDGTLVDYMKLSAEESVALISELLQRVRLVGGVFVLLWHNSTLLYPAYGDTYQRFLNITDGFGRFNWRSEIVEAGDD